jgi:hypothetical protein
MIAAEEHITVSRYAIDFKGPTLVVEYMTSKKKVFIRKIRFKRYPADVDPERVTKRLMKQFNDVLGPDRASKDQILEIVRLLLNSALPLSKSQHYSAEESSNQKATLKDDLEDTYGFAEEPDLNCVSEEENRRAKAIMGLTFSANAVRPGDREYVYNKPVEFGPPAEENEWDDED